MDLKSFLSPEDVLIDVRASDKSRLLQKLADRAANTLKLPADRIFRELSTREELGSTGTGSGIAVPHARVEGVKKPFGILVRLKQPMDFDAIDAKPVDLVFLLLLLRQQRAAAQAADARAHERGVGAGEVCDATLSLVNAVAGRCPDQKSSPTPRACECWLPLQNANITAHKGGFSSARTGCAQQPPSRT